MHHIDQQDIVFVVWKLSRFSCNPNEEHNNATERIFGYLKRTITPCLVPSFHSFYFIHWNGKNELKNDLENDLK